MAVYSCGRLLTQILEIRMISQLFSHQSSGRSVIVYLQPCSCRCLLNSSAAACSRESFDDRRDRRGLGHR